MEWRPIPGFEPYEASEAGEVRSSRPRYKKGYSPVLRPWIVSRNGRDAAYVTLCVGGKRNKQLVHRLVALAFHGVPPPECTDCCHKNHDSLDNRACNLEWGTHSKNISDWWEQRLEMLARLDDALGGTPSYNGPDARFDIPF